MKISLSIRRFGLPAALALPLLLAAPPRAAAATGCSAINNPCADDYEWDTQPKPAAKWRGVLHQQEIGTDDSPKIPCPVGGDDGGGDDGGGDDGGGELCRN